MARIMIGLAAAQQAIKSVIDYYSRDIAAIRERAAQRAPDEEPEEGEEALLIAARLAREGAEHAMHALETVPAFIAEDFACARIIDMERLPEDAQSRETAYYRQTMLEAIGPAAADHGMIKTDVLVDSDERPTQKRITLRFTMMRPMETAVHGEGGKQE